MLSFQHSVVVTEDGAMVRVQLDDGSILGIELSRVDHLVSALVAGKREAELATAVRPLGVLEAEYDVRVPAATGENCGCSVCDPAHYDPHSLDTSGETPDY